jgi:hypothetical protein
VNTNQLAKSPWENRPIGKLAILRRRCKIHEDDGRSVEKQLESGNKANGKIDILSLQNRTEWEYKK